jgi:hypothetical protein
MELVWTSEQVLADTLAREVSIRWCIQVLFVENDRPDVILTQHLSSLRIRIESNNLGISEYLGGGNLLDGMEDETSFVWLTSLLKMIEQSRE